MSIWRSHPRARGTTGATYAASQWYRVGTTSTRPAQPVTTASNGAYYARCDDADAAGRPVIDPHAGAHTASAMGTARTVKTACRRGHSTHTPYGRATHSARRPTLPPTGLCTAKQATVIAT